MRPRCTPKGATYLVTRRCQEGMLLLLPTAIVTQILLYCLARAQKRSGVKIHAFCFSSNHGHVLVSDPLGRLPKFLELFGASSARALNAHHGRRGPVWQAGECPHREILVGEEALVNALVYTLSNPLKDDLVERAEDWPGALSVKRRYGRGIAARTSVSRNRRLRRITVERPEGIFSERQPERAYVELSAPEWLSWEPEDYWRRLETLTRRAGEAASEARKAKGRGVMGVERLLAQDPETRIPLPERREGAKSCWSVTIAGDERSEEGRKLIRALVEYFAKFQERYRATYERQRARGEEKKLAFPEGTYALAERLGHPTTGRGAPLPGTAEARELPD